MKREELESKVITRKEREVGEKRYCMERKIREELTNMSERRMHWDKQREEYR